MNELIFFSTNLSKVKEIKKYFRNKKIKILTLNDFHKIKEPNEVGTDFKENAKIKSNFGFLKFGLPCFADDSGICISALNNKPGIYSKKFIKNSGGQKEALRIIINRAIKKNDFRAFFQTSFCLTTKEGACNYFEGIVKGKISRKPVGSKGFGYDPIFIPIHCNKTYAQMTIKEKNKTSHRGLAMNKLENYLNKII